MTTTITVEEMSVNTASKPSKNALENVDGVTQATADREAELATVDRDAELDTLVNAVNDAGYEASS